MKIKIIAACALASLMGSVTMAEVITVPVGQQADRASAGELQRKASAKVDVEAKFGAPMTATPAVGDPPISRWDYPAFSVYFESDSVLHVVVRQNKKP